MSKIAQGNVGYGLDKIAKEVRELKHSVAKILELLGPPKSNVVKYNTETTDFSKVDYHEEEKWNRH